MSSLRLAFRLAWRAARRERLATTLTAILVALPVVALVAAGVLARTADLPASAQARHEFGSADIVVQAMGSGAARLAPGGLPAGLPAGSRGLAEVAYADVGFTGPHGRGGLLDPTALAYDDPIARGIIVQRTGRAPRAPGEVVISTYGARRYSVAVGDSLLLSTTPATTVRVVGTIDDASDVRSRDVIGLPGGFGGASLSNVSYLVDLPAGADAGRIVLPGFSAFQPVRADSATALPDRNTINSGALVLVLALLEASLTAGTAFAVGARRRRRDLALIAVNGGRGPATGGVILANGLVCGLLGIVVGVLGGVGIAAAAKPALQQHTAQLLPALRVEPLLLLAAAAFGLISALLSAGLPALTAARTSLRGALGKTRGSAGTPRWIIVTGLTVFAVGIVIVAGSVRAVQQDRGDQTTQALLGVVCVELGGVAVCPALLGLAGRLGARLPALPRLALRDAARQRARSGPAVAAIAAAVSGAMAISVYVASDHALRLREYQPPAPHDLVAVSPLGTTGFPSTHALAALLGPDAVARAAHSTALTTADGPGITIVALGRRGARESLTPPEIYVGDADLARLFGASPAAQAALMSGRALVDPHAFNLAPASIGFAVESQGATERPAAVAPAMSASWPVGGNRPAVLLSPATAERVEASLPPTARVLSNQFQQLWAPLSPRLSNSARVDLQQRAADQQVSLTLDTGLRDTQALVALALLGVAGGFSLIVTAAATVLAAAESRADLAVLGAVGASRRARRLFTGAQGATTALLGGLLGIAIGLVPGIAVVQSSYAKPPLMLPWQPFAAFLVGLPLVAAAGGAAFSRSRLPGRQRTL